MRIRRMTILLVIVLLSIAGNGYAGTVDNFATTVAASGDVLYQVSTLDALMQGVYDGETTLDDLLQQGDFGIGTFEALDGEMVVLDGVVYQVLSSGKVVEAEKSMKTPFAMITVFQEDIQAKVADIQAYEQLKAVLDPLLPSANLFYALKIEGSFSYVKTRSVPTQAEPYPLLADVTSHQPTFEFEDVTGTVIGYWCPAYMEGINLPGYHLHFLSSDHIMGGHLLECTLIKGTVSIDTTQALHMLLPENAHFAQVDMSGVSQEEKEDVEQ